MFPDSNDKTIAKDLAATVPPVTIVLLRRYDLCTSTISMYIRYSYDNISGVLCKRFPIATLLFIQKASSHNSFHPFPSSLRPFTQPRPNIDPRTAPGLGRGHSRSLFGSMTSASLTLSVEPFVAGGFPSHVFPSASVALSPLQLSSILLLLRFRTLRPSGRTSVSASTVRGAGQGRRCGMPTTRKDMARVVPKSEVVHVERGWRCGGIVVRRK